MADLRISELRAITDSEVQANDEYPLADRSSNETRKITAANQAKSSINLLPNKGIPADKVNLDDVCRLLVEGSTTTGLTSGIATVTSGSRLESPTTSTVTSQRRKMTRRLVGALTRVTQTLVIPTQ